MSKKLETAFKTLLIEQQIINPSYTHYGGLTGFQDYGIIGSRIKQNLLSVWRQHWLKNRIDEVEVPDIAPYAVLKASGHVDKFSDQIVELNGLEIRADHLVKDIYKHLNLNEDSVDALTTGELEKIINDNIEYAIGLFKTSTNLPNASTASQVPLVLKVRTKSLMLGINDGSTYLMRPELAQTIYPNFRRYYNYHHGKLPFGIAQIGRSYRNEISPKTFERLRSFTQAEVEYFYDPSQPVHPEWVLVSSLIVPLLSSDSQLKGLNTTQMSLGDALSQGIIKDQITATFIGKVFLFSLDIGLKEIRFRQHLPTEMAHYANDCWDLECFVNNEKWLECVGIANRGDYDLKVHDRGNSFRLDRERTYITKLELNPEYIGKTYKSRAKEITAKFNAFNTIRQEIVDKVTIKLDDGLEVVIDKSHMREKEYVIQQESFYPQVIEPSFGIDRLFYAVLSQNYWIREDDTQKDITASDDVSFDDLRQVLSLRPCLSPYDVSVLYLVNNEALMNRAEDIIKELILNGFKIYNSIGSGSVGKKYVRSDRIGIPCVLTVDFDTLTDNKVTIRNRDDMTQVRVDIATLSETLRERLKDYK